MTFKNAEEVMALLTPIINKYKKFDPKTNRPSYKLKIDDLPDFYPNYKTAAKYAERIRIHSETGSFPESLFINRYPNQKDEEFTYMKNNYKQNTLPVFIDYISTITRPFSDGNWNIEYTDFHNQETDSFQEYVEGDIEVVKSVKDYVKSLLPTLKSVDANAMIAVRPEKIYEIVDEETQETVVDNSILVRPQPYYFPTIQVLTDPMLDDDYVILERNEKSFVTYGGNEVRKGHVFEIHDENNIWLAKQVGDFVDYKFQVELFYNHNAARVQAIRLKGIPQYTNGSYIWQSPFLYATDLLDLALMNANYLQCSVAQRMFPYLVMLGSPCVYKQKGADGIEWPCTGGDIFNPETSSYMKCPSCHGSGQKNRLSQMGVMLIDAPTSEPGSDVAMKVMDKAMYYVEPPVATAEFVLKKIEMDLSKAYEVIKAKRMATATGYGIDPGKGTATESILDVKAQYAAVKLFSDQAFSIYDFLLQAIGVQRYGNEFEKPVLIYPTSFDFNTEADYLNQITAAASANVPPPVIGKLIQKYLETIYYNQKKTAKIYDLISVTDRLFTLKQDDILMKINKNLVEPWEVILHDSALQFVEQLQIDNAGIEVCSVDDCTKGFFALDFKEQQDMLRQVAIDKAVNMKNVVPAGTSLVDRARMALVQ